MPTVFSHAVIGAAMGSVLRGPGSSARLWVAGAVCSVVPDVDVVAFWFGVPWGHVLGHRGITHSLAFAAVLAGVACWLAFRGREWAGRRRAVWLILFLATASHGLLDAMTDGGSGIAFLAPLDTGRYFLPWRPIPVSPIGLEPFLNRGGLDVLQEEMILLWLPAAILATAGIAVGHLARRRR